IAKSSKVKIAAASTIHCLARRLLITTTPARDPPVLERRADERHRCENAHHRHRVEEPLSSGSPWLHHRAKLRNGEASPHPGKALFGAHLVLKPALGACACRSLTSVGFGRAPCTFHRPDVDTARAVAFTGGSQMQRNLLIGIVIVVLIERARMRPGG